jgi:hypothetical protein
MTNKQNESSDDEPSFDEREIKNFERYQLLSDIIDTSFGTPSRKNAGYSIKMKVIGDELMQVTYTSVGNLAGNDAASVKAKFHQEAIDAIKKGLEVVKEDYLDASDSKISFKLGSEDENVELLQGAYGNPKRTCIYRLTCMVKIK